MPSLEQGLVGLLTSDAQVSALVGNRISPVYKAEGTQLPCISFMVASSSQQRTFQNQINVTQRVQFDLWGNNFSDVVALESAIQQVLDGLVGYLPQGPRIISSLRENVMQGFPNEARLYRTVVEYSIEFAV